MSNLTFKRLDLDALEHYAAESIAAAPTYVEHVAELMEMNPRGTRRLLTDVLAAVPKVPSQRRVIVLPLVLLVAALSFLQVSVPSAQAAAYPVVVAPVPVVISGPMTQLSLPVASTRPGVLVTLSVPTSRGGSEVVADGWSNAVGLATLRGYGPSTSLVVGRGQKWTIFDGTYPVTNVLVDVVRRSYVSLGKTAVIPGALIVTGSSRHYDVPSGTLHGDVASPVRIQVWRSGQWVTVQTATTAPDGSIFVIIPATGFTTVRIVRPAGANVAGGSSGTRTTWVWPALSAGF